LILVKNNLVNLGVIRMYARWLNIVTDNHETIHVWVACWKLLALCLWYDLKANNIAEFESFLSNWIAFPWNPEVRNHSIVFQVLLIHTKVFAFCLGLLSLWLCITVLWKVCGNMCARFNKFICDNALLISSWRMK
jgi:hypothetical protein